MSGARERILARLRAANAQAAGTPPDVAAYYGARAVALGASTRESRVARLCECLRASRADVIVSPRGEWTAAAVAALRRRGAGRLAHALDPAARALVAALPADIDAIAFRDPIEHWKREIFEHCDAGFTPAAAGVAATGALLLNHGRDLPRTLSLVPPVSLILVDENDIFDDLHSAASAQRWAHDMPTNRVLVSGPSKTADIQQTLAYGAHGPRELVVIVVTGGQGAA